jgi:C-terminal processing protease CtpA/Prc
MYEKSGSIEVIYNLPGEAAARAGLKKGDIIRAINGVRVSSVVEAQKILMSLRNDTIIDIEYSREGKTDNVLLALGSRKQRSFDLALRRDTMRNLVLPLFGMEIEPFGNYLFSERFMVKSVYEGSIADEIGLSVNDPLAVKGWRFSLKDRFALLRIEVKKRKAGFMQSTIQLITSIDSNNLL